MSITAGPRFLSVGLIVKLLFSFSSFNVLNCERDRFWRFSLLILLTRYLCACLRLVSKRVMLSSTSMEAGGGFHCLFF